MDAWERALDGGEYITIVDGAVAIPAGGCIGQAQSFLFGDRVRYWETFYRIQGWIQEASRAARADDEVVAALEAWRTCMGRAGWGGYEDPLELAPVFVVNGAFDPRIRADLECKQRTGLVDVWSRVEARYQGVLLAEHEAEILVWQDQRRRALRWGRYVLPGEG